MSENRQNTKRQRGQEPNLQANRDSSSSPEPEFEDTELIALRTLDRIGITELLERDSRPTLIIDLLAPKKEIDGRLKVTWSNKALKFFDVLRHVIHTDTYYPALIPRGSTSAALATAEAEFKKWAIGMPDFDNALDGFMPRHEFQDMYWTSMTLRGRWRVISASHVPNQIKKSHGTPRASRRSPSVMSSSERSSSIDASPVDTSMPDESELGLSGQLEDTQSKFRVLTELNPVGIYYLSPDGNILYCNDMWYNITGHPRGLEGEMSFMNVLSELDHPKMDVEWEILTTQKARRQFELRLREPWFNETTGKNEQKWILASCAQEFDEAGNLKTIMGCMFVLSSECSEILANCFRTDISAQKWAESVALDKFEHQKQIAEHAKNFQQMAELAPCGMFESTFEGRTTWANQQWYEMTGHPRNMAEHTSTSFLDCVYQDDRAAYLEVWDRLTVSKEEVNMELRLKKPWIREAGEDTAQDVKWILFDALPQFNDQGKLIKVLGCTTDISPSKFVELSEIAHRKKAEQAKLQQEAFIDMTSHEMRNPLSAIMLCADGIANSVIEYQSTPNHTHEMMRDLLENNLDAAQTIVLCAQHQKRIIDDVLTLSKLNSTMLAVSPVQVEIKSTIRKTLKMFEGELLTHDIKIDFNIGSNYQREGIDWVYCDPVRLTQIFINLLTNAIKFTRCESRREISVNLDASVQARPSETKKEVEWFPSKATEVNQDLTLAPDWGTGRHVFLYFAVTDTGKGLSEIEKGRLFRRFSQASPKTHVQYGGSGLGLFISRELTELQGGQIGVASKEGLGSTFAFYIKARKATEMLVEAPAGISYARLSSTANGRAHLQDNSLRPLKLKSDYHILLVEDNLINQKVLSKQLRSTGSVVHVANHGVEALDFLSKTVLWKDDSNLGGGQKMALSLILMDLEMPIMDGLACTRRIRDLEREGSVIGHVPIIAVTANTRMEQMDQAREAGMDDIVAKPFQIPELIRKMDQLMASAIRQGVR